MRQSVSRDLYAYWNQLRGDRAAPDRTDIDPAAIRHVLADSFIIEVEPACVFPIRLCGTRLNALWLADQKGKSFLDLWREEDRRNVAAALLTVIDGITPVVAGALARAPSIDRVGLGGVGGGVLAADLDRDMNLELLLLPLRHFGKTHSRLLGSLASSDQTPWLGRAVASPLHLKSLRVLHARQPLLAAPPRRGVPKLVVLEGGKMRM